MERNGSVGALKVIVDCHCQAGKGDGLTGPWDTAAPLGKYLRRAAAAGITRSAIFAPFHSDYTVANRAVARIVTGWLTSGLAPETTLPIAAQRGHAWLHPDRATMSGAIRQAKTARVSCCSPRESCRKTRSRSDE